MNRHWKNELPVPYIRLFTRNVLSANSSLKSCIKSTWVNFSRNPSERFKSTLFARLCQINAIEFFWILILSRTWRKMDARRKKLIYGTIPFFYVAINMNSSISSQPYHVLSTLIDWFSIVLYLVQEYFTQKEISALLLKEYKILAFAHWLQPVNREGSLWCHSCYDTGPPFTQPHPKVPPCLVDSYDKPRVLSLLRIS